MKRTAALSRARPAAAIAALVLCGVSGAGSRALAQSATPAPPPPHRNIAGPGDYGLREKIVRQLGADGELSKEKFSIVLVNGGAGFSGEIKNCVLKKRALTTAAATRGGINVTDEMVVPRGDLPHEALAKGVTSPLSHSAANL